MSLSDEKKWMVDLKHALSGGIRKMPDALEAYVDKKLKRFYVTKKEHEQAKKQLIYELEKAKHQIRLLEAERASLITSSAESRHMIEELSGNARKLLELNCQLKELLENSQEIKQSRQSKQDVLKEEKYSFNEDKPAEDKSAENEDKNKEKKPENSDIVARSMRKIKTLKKSRNQAKNKKR